MRFENKTMAALVVVLFVSLMGNMFALGYYFGGGHNRSAASSSLEHEQHDRGYRASLSPDDRKIIRREMLENRETLRQAQNTWKNARKEAGQLLEQENYDAAQYQDLKNKEREAFLNMQKEMEQIWSKIAPQLSEDGRKQMAKIMAQGVNLRTLRQAVSGDHSKNGPGAGERRPWQKKREGHEYAPERD